MVKRLLSLMSICLFCSSIVIAQSGTLTGNVTDQSSGEGLPGVNIFIPDLQRGAATDAQGQYSIENIEYGTYTIRASYVGYETIEQQVTVNQSTQTLDFALNPQVEGLEGVVVTALGIERTERSLGYSVERVGGDELSETKETNFVTSLTGKVAGANISNSNAMGGSSRITLRGAKSITGNNQPLFVIDGIPLNNSNYTESVEDGALRRTSQTTGRGGYDFGNAASMIDPNNIESVTVLKGPGASALYGSRGANGVIEITTKDGSASQGLGVTINSGVTFKQIYGLADYQNKYGGGANAPFQEVDGEQFVDYATDESWGPRLDGRMVRQWYSFDDVNGLNGEATPWVAHPDNIKDFFNTGVSFRNNISLSQGSDKYAYRLSISRLDETGVYPESNLDRKQVGFNGKLNLSDKLTASISSNYIYEDTKGRPGTGYDNINVFQQFNQFGQRQVDLGPNSYLADYTRPDGSQRTWNWTGIAGARDGEINFSDAPYWVRNKNYATDDTQRLFGDVSLTYDFTDYLNIQGTVQTDYFTNRRGTRLAIGSQDIPSFEEQVREVQETNALLRLNFDRSLNESFTLDAFAEGKVRYNNFSRNINASQGGLSVPNIYTIENSVSRPILDDYFEQSRLNSVLGQATLGYNEMVYLDLVARNDWSSTLPSDNNSYLYYGATGSFIFTELDAFNNSDILSFGKVRLAYSKTGNATDPYRLNTTYPITLPFGSSPQLSVSTRLNNSNLIPEETFGWEVGTQLEFFNNRASLDVTYYNERSENQIIPVDVSRASGYSSIIINAGELTNKGLEVAFDVTPMELANGLSWNISANWAKNINTVEELSEGLNSLELGTAPFQVSVHARVGETYGALLGTNFQYDDNGNKVITSRGTYAIDNTQQVLGSYVPDWTGGLSTSLFYKGFTASVSIDGQKGGDIYSISNAFGRYSGILDITARNDIREAGLIAEGVQEDGSPNTVRADPETFFKSLFGLDAANVYDASYIKLREARLSYALPVNTFGGTPIKGITISAIGRNLATLFKNTPNMDPANVISTSNIQGIEAGQIPPQRSYGLSIQLDL